jgi:ABC-2 type transport system permease protein
MGLLLANPVRRSKIVLEKAWAMVVYAFVVGFAIFASVAIGSLLGGLGMNLGDVAATSLLVTLVGLVFGSLSLALSAGTGQVRIALYGAVGAALIFYVLNAFLQLDANLGEWARVSPFYYYLGSDPLLEGMHWGHGALLGGLSVSLIGLAVWLFSKRDLRQTG